MERRAVRFHFQDFPIYFFYYLKLLRTHAHILININQIFSPSCRDDNHDVTPAETFPCSTSLKVDFLLSRLSSFLSIFIILIPDGPAEAPYSTLIAIRTTSVEVLISAAGLFLPSMCTRQALISFFFFTRFLSSFLFLAMSAHTYARTCAHCTYNYIYIYLFYGINLLLISFNVPTDVF